MQNSLAHIPQIEKLLSHGLLTGCISRIGRPAVARIAAGHINGIRTAALQQGASIPSLEECAAEIQKRCFAPMRKRISPVINATGIILHTNLGRSPLPEGVWQAAQHAAESYAAIEMSLEDGKRGARFPFLLDSMNLLTGAEASLIVNNNAAAVFLLLKALAGNSSKNEVIVSRGQQVQIGGGFRVPDILRDAGCRLIEVGTTNITTLADIQAAVTENTAMVLWVHTSNYKIRGFTAVPSLPEIKAALPGHVMLAVDQGSGALVHGIADEPSVPQLLKEGADIVCFSGDKMLGGPQCGWIAGKKAAVNTIARHPLMRTYRVGKAVAALMEETLVYYLNGGKSAAAKAVRMNQTEIKKRCTALAEALSGAEVVSAPFSIGGGSTPDEVFPSWAVRIQAKIKPDKLKDRLRRCSVPIIAFIADDRLLIHLAAVSPSDDAYIAASLNDILTT